MRRALVIGDEGARHPFLASLPPHVRGGAKQQPPARKWAVSTVDVRDFLAAYSACFVAVSLYIA